MTDQEHAAACVKAIELLATEGAKIEDHDVKASSRGWFSIDEDGGLIFNNEYPIGAADAVNMAIVLLGYARRQRRI